jgi:hypothetical protein
MRGTWQTTDGGSGGGLVLAVIAAAVLIGSGAASAITSAIVTIIIITGCTIAAVTIAGIGVLVYRVRSERRGAPNGAQPVYELHPEIRHGVSNLSRPAVEPPREIHLHFHGADPDRAAAIIRNAITEGK